MLVEGFKIAAAFFISSPTSKLETNYDGPFFEIKRLFAIYRQIRGLKRPLPTSTSPQKHPVFSSPDLPLAYLMIFLI